MNSDKQASTVKKWYHDYYSKQGVTRNSLRANSGVLFQTLAYEASIVRSFAAIQQDGREVSVLDVGCGSGGDLYNLLRLDYSLENITGVDINDERIKIAKEIFPLASFVLTDATNLTFDDQKFDLVFESTMFSTIPDDEICTQIASEMIRVCKVNGYIVLADWRISKFWDRNYNALTRNKLDSFFLLNKKTELLKVSYGALIPPLGRFISKYLSPLYFLLQLVFPFFVGQVVYVLKRRA